MRLFWIEPRAKKSVHAPGARCPDCHCELPIMFEQALRLADDEPVWLFCPLCKCIVRAEAFVREQTAAPAKAAERAPDRSPSPAIGSLQFAR